MVEVTAADHRDRGWKLFEQRRPGAAEKAFRAALALDAGELDAQVGLGLSVLSGGKEDEAVEALDKALEMGSAAADVVRGEGASDAFERPTTRSYIRAAHTPGLPALRKRGHGQGAARLGEGLRD